MTKNVIAVSWGTRPNDQLLRAGVMGGLVGFWLLPVSVLAGKSRPTTSLNLEILLTTKMQATPTAVNWYA